MKFQIISDTHNEFSPNFRILNAGSDVLILSGDICVAEYFTRSEASPHHAYANEFREFFKACSGEFEKVFYVPGNHEHYRSKLTETCGVLREVLEPFENISLLDGEYEWYNGVMFFGATLWTDLNGGNPLTAETLRTSMNDYRLIQGNGYRAIKPADTARIHGETLTKIRLAVDGEDKVVVIGHHAPHPLSIDKVRYGNDFHMNGGYHSNLENFILDHPQIKLWTSGHMHNSSDYLVGDTRVVCNPRGYNDENLDFDPNKIIEV